MTPIFLSTATKKNFPSYTLNAFSYGTAVKKLYGVPAAVENIGLVVNTKLAKVPTTFAQLEKEALAVKKKKHQTFGIAVQQGSGGDAYHMYPFFSGLGGYVFGTNKAGNLDPSDIGVANPTFLKNSKLIDKWNKEGLISSKVDGSAAQNAFIKGQAAFWVTGPWNADMLKKSGLSFKVDPGARDREGLGAVPRRPGLHGHEVRRDARRRLGGEGPRRRTTWRRPAHRRSWQPRTAAPPANLKAKSNDPSWRSSATPSKGGVPMPNIPQMNSVWADLGQAWVRSTKGSGSMTAAKSFKAAARSIAAQDRLVRNDRRAPSRAPRFSPRASRERDHRPDPRTPSAPFRPGRSRGRSPPSPGRRGS